MYALTETRKEISTATVNAWFATYERLKNDIQTYENNLSFLSSSSKKGNTLVADITRKIERLKKDMELVLKKIKDIDESLKEKE